MLIDLEQRGGQNPTQELVAEVCVIGGGMAGIAMALAFERDGVPCVVLESGGFGPENATRDLARGSSLGREYHFADGCRSRFLGGSSNCWGGWCRPLDEQDFQTRHWVPHSGWPIGPEALAPHYKAAHEILRLGPPDYDVPRWAGAVGRADVKPFPMPANGPLTERVSLFSPPVRLGLDHGSALRAARHVTVVLHASVTRIEQAPGQQRVTAVHAQSLKGQRISVRAKLFVLAAGGIENARLLLACADRPGPGLGNSNDLVGRFFMDHPRHASGRVMFAPGWRRNKLYDHKFHYQNPLMSVNGHRFAAQLMLSPEIQRREGLLNANLWFESLLPGDGTPTADVIIRMKHRLERKERQGYSFLGDMARVMRHP